MKTYIFVFLNALIVLLSCKKENKDLFFIYSNEKIEIKADSIYNFPELTIFPIRMSIKNTNNYDAILFFNQFDIRDVEKSVKSFRKNLFFVSSKGDTCFIGLQKSTSNYLIVRKNTIYKFDCVALFNFSKEKKKGYFNDFKDLDEVSSGKLVYQLDRKNMAEITKDSIKSDTLVAPYYVEIPMSHIVKTNFQGGRPIEIPIK